MNLYTNHDLQSFIRLIRRYFSSDRSSGFCHFLSVYGYGKVLTLLKDIARTWPHSKVVTGDDGEINLLACFIPAEIGGDATGAINAYEYDSDVNGFTRRKTRRMFAAFAVRRARRMLREKTNHEKYIS